jgi:hypothetical protein
VPGYLDPCACSVLTERGSPALSYGRVMPSIQFKRAETVYRLKVDFGASEAADQSSHNACRDLVLGAGSPAASPLTAAASFFAVPTRETWITSLSPVWLENVTSS